MHITLITVRTDLTSHDSFSNSTAWFAVMPTAQTEFALPRVIGHLGEEINKVLTSDIPQTKFTHTGRIYQRAAKIQLEHLQMSCRVTSFALLSLADFFDA